MSMDILNTIDNVICLIFSAMKAFVSSYLGVDTSTIDDFRVGVSFYECLQNYPIHTMYNTNIKQIGYHKCLQSNIDSRSFPLVLSTCCVKLAIHTIQTIIKYLKCN